MELCTQTIQADHEVKIIRRVGSHHPTVWGDHFLAYANLPEANEGEKKQHEDLKEEVRKMLVMAPSNSLEKLELINTIQCLGVAYHFEREIEEALSYMCTHYEEYWIGDLHDIALCFRLLSNKVIMSHVEEKEQKIRELTAKLESINQQSEVYRANLLAVLKDMEEEKLKLSVKVQNARLSLKE